MSCRIRSLFVASKSTGPDIIYSYYFYGTLTCEMASRKDQNIFTVTFPFYVIFKVFGMFPASFAGESRLGVFKVKWYDKIVSLMAFAIMVCVTLIHIFYPIKKFNKSILVITGWQIR